MSAGPPQIGEAIAGYSIERLLGRGGMGAVFLATHRQLDRRAAVKVLIPELAEDESFRERFVKESQLAASLDHPNVIPIYDAGEAEGRLFIAMRYVDGPDLKEVLRSDGPLPPERTAEIVDQIAGALDAAHAAGLVHRDVKPANILIEQPSGKVFLSDFGVAKRAGSVGFTRTGAFLGSVDYCPPEQIHGRPLDGRADVYSLGCVVFHCLAGQPPFPKETEVAVIQAHLADPVPALSTVRPGLPLGLDGVIVTAMAKNPEVRFATAGELATALQAAIRGEATPKPTAETVAAPLAPRAHEPVPATRPQASPPPARGRSWGKIAVAAAVLLALAGGAFAVALLAGSGGGETATSTTTRTGLKPSPHVARQGPTFNTRIARIVDPLAPKQRLVTSQLSSLAATPASFAALRRSAKALDDAALRARGAADTLDSRGDSERRAKSALVLALTRQAAYAAALESLGDPGSLTRAQSAAVADRAAATHDAYGNLAAVTGPPCCEPMPVGRASARPLERIAEQQGGENALRSFGTKIESVLRQSSSGRTEIRSALAGAMSCTTFLSDAATRVDRVADNRQSVLNQLASLETPTARAARIASLLQSSMSHSIAADRHYSDWLRSLSEPAGACDLPHTGDFELAQQEDRAATAAKQAFVNAYNPLAAQLGLRTWSETEV